MLAFSAFLVILGTIIMANLKWLIQRILGEVKFQGMFGSSKKEAGKGDYYHSSRASISSDFFSKVQEIKVSR
jgi:hypothetical protein